jgi:hypothetical protein
LVYFSGPKVGTVYTVTKIDPTDWSKMPAVGVIIYKPTTTTCVLQFEGEVTTSGLVTGKCYFAGTGGVLSATPVTPGAGQKIYNQIVGLATSSTLLRLNLKSDIIVTQG